MASGRGSGGKRSDVSSCSLRFGDDTLYSLIHDDLPAMDDDDYRRGMLTNHKVFGEAMAILAGDALLTHAFYVLSHCLKYFPAESVNQVVGEVSKAAGTFGMVGGQVVDIESEGKDISREELDYIHENKTAALFVASVRTGGILAGANSVQMDALTDYARHLGLAFQITDDILDITGDSGKLGKNTGSDTRKKKVTFPLLYGLEESRKMALDESRKAGEIVRTLGNRAKPWKKLSLFGSRDF